MVDVLSDIVASLRTGPAVASRTVGRSPWGIRFTDPVGMVFHVALHGTCWLTPDGSEPMALAPGDVVLLPHPGPHVLADAPGTPTVNFADLLEDHSSSIGSVRVGGDGPEATLLCGAYLTHRHTAHPLLDTMPATVHVPAHPRRHRSLHDVTTLLAEEVDRHDPGAAAAVTSLVDAMLIYVVRAALADGHHGWDAALSDPAVSRALGHIHRDPGTPWTVERLASEVGLSRATFARRFRDLVGEPPMAYLTRWRMTSAAQRLRETTAPLATIARDAGYTSEFAFSKAFKRLHGLAPGVYRRTTGLRG